MGKGSNISKANRAREDAAKRAKQEGKGGGGKSGMKARKDANVADKIAAAQAEREVVRKQRAEKKIKAEKEAKSLKQKMASTTQKKSKNGRKKNDLSLLEEYLN